MTVNIVGNIRCDMCRREFEPDAPMGFFMDSRWAEGTEGTEAYDLCAECCRIVEGVIMHGVACEGFDK